MNKKLFIIIGMVIVLMVFAAFVFWHRSVSNQTPMPPVTQEPGGSVAINPPAQIPGGHTSATMSLRTADGGSIRTKDFKQDPAIEEDPVNPGYYYLGYHIADYPAKKAPYLIEYRDATQYFNIVLLQEPIGAARRAAEIYLVERLGISQSQMCRLQYTVSVPDSIDGTYTTMNLGFSFCPGSVALPE